MKTLTIKTGEIIYLDDCDYDILSQWKWRLNNCGYAIRSTKEKSILMHRYILSAKKGQYIDHINRNKLDNQKSNLRIVTARMNMLNTDMKISNTSGYKGVCKTPNGTYRVKLCRKHLGCFETPQIASEVYKKALAKLWNLK